MRHFGDIAFTDTVRSEQTRLGSREAYAKMTAQPAPERLSEKELEFIAARDSFYMATVSETGWPYVQHRGGPRGFLKVLGPALLGFADFRGNRQYVSTGNLKTDDRTALFLMDYPNRRRLKILARSTVVPAETDPELAAKLTMPGDGRIERLFLMNVEAFDWNCSQFITPRFTEEELGPMLDELEALREENKRLKENNSTTAP
jgi:predicted pyridoxine 5'-phosphate oxidase superfamily flavin-nucleotide-binding protein